MKSVQEQKLSYYHSNKIKETVPNGSFDTINEDVICPSSAHSFSTLEVDEGNRGIDFHLEWEFGSVFFEMKTLKSLLVIEGGL